MEDIHWADYAATRVIKEKGDKKLYVCASGISPSGDVHIGNFREIITTDLVVKALQRKGKKTRFIYSWDDYDPFRKVPKDIPDSFKEYLGMPYSDIPDPYKCHKSYADHFISNLEESIRNFGFNIEFIRQSVQYKKCRYAKEIKKALDNKDKIIKVLNGYRRVPLEKNWYPISIYCSKCGKNTITVLAHNGYELYYECNCGFSEKFDFRKRGIVSLKWRVDWPMRWNYEKVDFEPGGKDHSTVGGSYDTAKQIVKEVWNREAPTYQMYDFVRIKGSGGKISSSLGNAITPRDVLEVYEPEIVRYLFVGTKSASEFAISFDLDVMKIYEDFDFVERVYFNKENIANEKEKNKLKRIYEYSSIKVPKTMPEQPSFRHMTVLTQIYEGDLDMAIKGYKSKRVKMRARCAWNWIQSYAPDSMKFNVHGNIPEEIKMCLTDGQKEAIKELIVILKKNKRYTDQSLFDEFYRIIDSTGIKNTEFFNGVYLALIGKEKGPKLANFILVLGKKRTLNLLKQVNRETFIY